MIDFEFDRKTITEVLAGCVEITSWGKGQMTRILRESMQDKAYEVGAKLRG